MTPKQFLLRMHERAPLEFPNVYNNRDFFHFVKRKGVNEFLLQGTETLYKKIPENMFLLYLADKIKINQFKNAKAQILFFIYSFTEASSLRPYSQHFLTKKIKQKQKVKVTVAVAERERKDPKKRFSEKSHQIDTTV
jgi:hypothetical protein